MGNLQFSGVVSDRHTDPSESSALKYDYTSKLKGSRCTGDNRELSTADAGIGSQDQRIEFKSRLRIRIVRENPQAVNRTGRLCNRLCDGSFVIKISFEGEAP